MTDPLSSLLRAAHLMSPSRLATTVATHGRALGVAETVLYLADYEQVALLPLPGDGVPERQELPIEGTLAGLAFRRVEVVGSAAGRGYRLWVPGPCPGVLSGGEDDVAAGALALHQAG